MKRYIYIASALLMFAVCESAHAQELDPTVVVNRAYEGQLVDVSKPSFDMMVPDSVTRFDLDFDYTVFEKPYRGSYEFNPYLLKMQPSSAAQKRRQLYVKAGAGYTLHPTLDVVWSPTFNGPFRIDVYGLNRSYFGSYRNIGVTDNSILDRVAGADGKYSYWKGYDSYTRGGVDGSYDWERAVFEFDASYLGIANKDPRKIRHFDGVQVQTGVSSKTDVDSTYVYDVCVGYSFGVDNLNFAGSREALNEHVLDVTGRIGRTLKRSHLLMFDLGLEFASLAGPDVSSLLGQLYLTPHYVLKKSRWSVDAGVRFDLLVAREQLSEMYPTSGQLLYPDVKAWFDVIPEAMRLYAAIGGGNRLHTYASTLKENHHFDPTFSFGKWPLMDVAIERVSASAGLAGRVSSVFSYDVRAGYVNYKNARLDVVEVIDGVCLPGFGYSGYQKFYAAMDLHLKTESVRFDGNVEYTLPWAAEFPSLIMPSPLKGNAAAEYNWKRRVFAGVDCDFALARKSADYTVPAYADLGVYAEVAANGCISFWLRGGNLLNMTIQRNLLYAEKGINFTAGICLNL